MATLNDVVVELKTLNNSTLEIALYAEPMFDLVSSLEKMMQKFMDSNDQLRYQMMESQREAANTANAVTPAQKAEDKKDEDKSLGLFKKLGIGAAIAAMGGGLLKGAAGIASMGIAISAFFGGLVLGEKMLSSDWFNSNLDFTYIKKAARGFAEIVKELGAVDLIVLGGIMGISAVGGWKAALGLGTMGAAISSFFTGLLVGDMVFQGLDWLGYNFDYSGLAKAAKGFSEVIQNLGLPAVGILGAIIGASAFAGMMGKKPYDAAMGVGVMGAAISAFFAGLLIGDAALSFLKVGEWGGLAGATKVFAEAIGNLDGPALAALGLLLTAGGVLGTFAKWGGAKVAAGMGAVGAGIGAFFAGFAGLGKYAGEGENISALLKNFSQAISNLSGEAVGALAGMMAAGGILGMIGVKGAAYFTGGMAALGAGIAAFFVGMDGIAKVGKWFGVDGSSASTITGNFVAALKPLETIDADKVSKAGDAIVKVAAGFAAWKAIEFADMFTSFIGIFKDDPITKFVDGIKPLENLDPTKYDGFEKIVDKLQYFSTLDLTNAVNGMKALKDLNAAASFNPDMSSSVLNKVATDNLDLKATVGGGNATAIVAPVDNSSRTNINNTTMKGQAIDKIGTTNTYNAVDFFTNGYAGQSLIGGF